MSLPVCKATKICMTSQNQFGRVCPTKSRLDSAHIGGIGVHDLPERFLMIKTYNSSLPRPWFPLRYRAIPLVREVVPLYLWYLSGLAWWLVWVVSCEELGNRRHAAGLKWLGFSRYSRHIPWGYHRSKGPRATVSMMVSWTTTVRTAGYLAVYATKGFTGASNQIPE